MPVTVESGVSGPLYPNGVTTEFPFAFKADSASEVVVTDQDGEELSSALYSVSLNAGEGGTVTFSTAPELADYPAIFIVSVPAMTQGSDFGNTGPSFNPASVTRALDRAAVRDIFLKGLIDRAPLVPVGEDGGALPSVSERLGKYFAWDAEGVAVAASGTGADSALRTDMAASGGASLLGWIRAVTGAVARSASALFTERTPTPLDFLSVAEAAKVYAGTASLEDHGPAIQKANDIGRGVNYPGVLYSVRTPVTGVKGAHKGAGQFRTEIRALAAMDQLFKVEEARASLTDLFFNGNYQADLVVHIANSNGFSLSHCKVEKGNKDGVNADPSGNNNNMSFRDNIIRYHGGGAVAGTGYTTGTATVSAASDTITITDAADLTTLGFRLYLTNIFMAGDKPRTVVEITATTIKVSRPIATAFTGVAFEIWDGGPIAITRYSDNGIADIQNNTLQNLGKGVGITVHSLYGPKIRGNTYESLWIAGTWGIAGAGVGAINVNGGSDRDSYYEAVEYEHRIEACNQVTIQVGQNSLGFAALDLVDPNYVSNFRFETLGSSMRGPMIVLTNVAGSANLSLGRSYVIQQSSGAADFDLNLPVIGSDPDVKRVLTYLPLETHLYFTSLGGKTATIKSSEFPINGVAGATGIAHTTNYTKLSVLFFSPGGTDQWNIS